MAKQVGRVTYEGRYVIIEVPDDWQAGQPLPPPSAKDRWFRSAAEFVDALGEPYDHRPINRRPWNTPMPPSSPARTDDKLDR